VCTELAFSSADNQIEPGRMCVLILEIGYIQRLAFQEHTSRQDLDHCLYEYSPDSTLVACYAWPYKKVLTSAGLGRSAGRALDWQSRMVGKVLAYHCSQCVGKESCASRLGKFS
jgi:hypothetical protein